MVVVSQIGENTKAIYSITAPFLKGFRGFQPLLFTLQSSNFKKLQLFQQYQNSVHKSMPPQPSVHWAQLLRARAGLQFLKRVNTKKIPIRTSLHTYTYDRSQCTAPHYHFCHLFCGSSFPSSFTHLRAAPQLCAAHPSRGRDPTRRPLPLPCGLRSRPHGLGTRVGL